MVGMNERDTFVSSDDTVRKNRKPNRKEPYVKSREKTPKWLNKNKAMIEIRNERYDQDLEEQRKVFQKQLEKDWEY